MVPNKCLARNTTPIVDVKWVIHNPCTPDDRFRNRWRKVAKVYLFLPNLQDRGVALILYGSIPHHLLTVQSLLVSWTCQRIHRDADGAFRILFYQSLSIPDLEWEGLTRKTHFYLQ